MPLSQHADATTPRLTAAARGAKATTRSLAALVATADATMAAVAGVAVNDHQRSDRGSGLNPSDSIVERARITKIIRLIP
ncbi:hypothetical protein GCM10017567_57490 [Amycolatopsis bullii]|uniref:Transposase n=1 Tax=Amycolatopsis bullii TaxID=941987 RepID=A0ABQ3KSP1_9PSEU|nr:hypothetical protein GCM10017567_57490 [Amycolatopsis bullii]